MKLFAREVLAECAKQMPAFPRNEELMQQVIDSFDYLPNMDTILYRYSDVLVGNTKIVGQDVIVSMQSAVTELDLTPEMYKKVTKAGIMTIADINLSRCEKVLSFEDYGVLTAAMLTLGV